MRMRTLGNLWPVSALTLGGGGIGQVWGQTTRDEAIATVLAAVDGGISLIDVAPTYGGGEAERVVGEAFDGRLPDGVRVVTKHLLGNPPANEVQRRLERSLDASLDRMRLSFVDLFVLHGYIVNSDDDGADDRTARSLFVEAVRPAFERLVAQGRIGAWGITAVAEPSAIVATLAEDPAPGAAQIVTNLLDSPGDMFVGDEEPRPREIVAAAASRGTGVMGIRAVQAGALTDRIDRERPDAATMSDFRRAELFRAVARELAESPASLAHRYALSMPGVDTVVLGVKDRNELRECLEAEEKGRLASDVVAWIDEAVGSRGRPGPELADDATAPTGP